MEAHIEKGVAISTVEQYVRDPKLRFMVLRLKRNPIDSETDFTISRDAALSAYQTAMNRHVPYDFKMNIEDTNALFCSEVGSLAYRKQGIQLWKYPSHISAPGVERWLHYFGVDHFETQMPSDLEYDPQLQVIAEWRNRETLLKDHMDNAVMDVLIESANRGQAIPYDRWLLPIVRIVKTWCIFQNWMGHVSKIPEGMSAAQALRNQSFVRLYDDLRRKTAEDVDQFRLKHQYLPPYWQMIQLARTHVGVSSLSIY